ncbi:DeoR family transcriptional regulator [Ornithinibacillus salinisoli]|uniref:DeoR family transcriptional regulator n=1 Tax=Ornithinibacillus salinisoli TaxID=1848459 RepID=A0ABW4VYV9_9BACI
MLPVERQNRIKDLILSNQSMKISELSKELGVSEMTVHRDIKPLIVEGIIKKTFGGITTLQETASPTTNDCIICGNHIQERLAYRLILPGSKIETACCSHCGLIRHNQLGDEVMEAICFDFFRQTTISAHQAWFVMNSSVNIGCCQPQILTFELKDHAEKFITGFGGKVYTFNEAIQTNLRKMQSNSCHE